ncbi:MAG: ATP-dependent DNA helicase [Peptococcaceae bacterium BICA1-7]|nr:MAG: ATP-dependent DNA helicase [Peptococcaceae bacterium BICA1-7]HBV97608.1 ATP-dependent DNA helicase [Desulfotomaculum sp.]
MGSYQQNHREESDYLERVTSFIKSELDRKTTELVERKGRLVDIRRDMYENTVHFSNDFDRLTEANQYLSEVNYQTAYYNGSLKEVERQQKMLDSPYFGRFDFIEDGLPVSDKIYVGISSVMDSLTNSILVYDWRAPIAGMFYQHEPGRAGYDAPAGIISGEMLLKRQYKIKDSQLRYFYDCGIKINDEILQEVLSKNASPRMKNIVETIQKEQDTAIRDTENDILIVQGVVGSGKTSIALHRIAFLLYRGMNSGINRSSFIIISPNAVFSKYISSVLPELGEENVDQITFDDIAARLFDGRMRFEPRSGQLELLTTAQGQGEAELRRSGMEFKGSLCFVKLLDRLIQHFERSMIPFEDVYYDGRVIETRQRIKNIFLDNKYGTPMAKRLKRIENIILNKVHPLQRKRLAKIEKTVADSEGHELEVKSFSRLLSIKKTRVFMDRLRRFTEVDYVHLYKALFDDSRLFNRLARGMALPLDIDQIIDATRGCLEKGYARYEDCGPLLYLKLRVEGSSMFPDIKQVVIDEAQDYYPVHYEVFKLLFRDARYTVLGDIHQSIERDADISLYDDITKILGAEKTLRLVLNKSYRSSYEINQYTRNLLAGEQEFISFNRHGTRPAVVRREDRHQADRAIAEDIDLYFAQGYRSIAVITKSRAGAEALYSRLKDLTEVNLAGNSRELKKGALVIPAYTAKGLEFDVVLVDDVSRKNYFTGHDRKLLYIACTRALHRLALYYTGEKSQFA